MDFADYCLETKNLILRKAKSEDMSAIYHNLWCHPESAKYMLWDVTRSEEDAADRIRRTVAFQRAHKHTFFICEKISNRPIGFAGMNEVEPGVFEDTGIALGPQYTGIGYGTQVLNALTDEAKACGAHKFIASCRKQNIASHNLQMHCSFSFMKEEMRVDPRTGEEYILEFNEKDLS